MTTPKRITRSSGPDGNLVKIAKPEFLSLVGKPANQRPFPVIRSADAGKRVTRTKRGDNAVLMLTFPPGYDEVQVATMVSEFGMVGYEISTDGDRYYARRSDLQSIAKVEEMKPQAIRITSDGVMAAVDPNQYAPRTAESVAKIGLAAFEFDAKTFDQEKIISWGKQNSVDIQNDAIENSSCDVISVSRGEVSEETEVKRIQIEEGVVAVVYRCCDEMAVANPIPDGYVAAIVETAYGHWGWGQLDFDASMADRAFCDLMDSAEYRLSSVIRDILFYNDLPLESRKQLVTRCLQQYEAFVNGAIDSLPRQVLLLASRADVSKNPSLTREDDTMKIDAVAAQKELDAIEAKRADEAAKAAEATATAEADAKRADEAAAAAAPAVEAAPAVAAAEAPITRAEMSAMIATAVAAAMAPAAPAAAAAPAAEPVARADAAPTITTEAIAAAVAAAVAPLTEKIERMEGTTVVRSGDTDQKQAAPAAVTQETVFRGAFGNLGGRAAQ